MKNLFCDHDVLRNEADVEQNFARRLIEGLGYSDRAIRPKAALAELSVGRLGDTRLYRPDFAMKSAGHIRWILEAKSPAEQLDRHFDQANGYCNAINGSYSRAPVKYFVLTNGIETRVYRTGDTKPALRLAFEQFIDRNPDYHELTLLLRPRAFARGAVEPADSDVLHFTKPTIAEVNIVFAKCHQFIHQSDKISQAKGFEEFVKLITLKLLSDKAVKDTYPGVAIEKQFDHPANDVKFSLRWITTHQASTPNPVDSIQFKDFMDQVELEIAKRLRKRFFDEGDRINLKPETIRGVVERLQSLYLFGIDADLNGRLFENFLSATMRGKDLGQYFTPRTLVKLGVGLGDLKTSDMVLDGCCGTGGFLIDALAAMWTKVNNNASLSNHAKAAQRRTIAHNRIYGIDFAKSPNLAKIARLNMYLHGDGGSRIFNVDGLDLQVRAHATDRPEEATEKDELRDLRLLGRFDIVLTNPPFSKKYDRDTEGDAWVLDQYTVATGKRGLLAKLMFFEMYHHYLKPGGRLVSVIDDGFLNGNTYRAFRDMLRRLYIVKAVISLPGDAFQRSEARVKTSFIVLEKRAAEHMSLLDDDHPAIFMYACRYVGIDDPKRQRWMPGDEQLRQKAALEVQRVVEEYRKFISGSGDPNYIVPAERATDRLDVKHCLIDHNWRGASTDTVLSEVADVKEFGDADTIVCEQHELHEQLFTVKYDGTPTADRVIIPRTETEYPELYRVRQGEIVISNIAVTYGSVAVVPSEMDGMVVSKEYTVLRTKPGYDARVVCAVLRSPEIRAQLLLRTTGANRTRVRWSDICEIAFPYPDAETERIFIQHIEDGEAARARALREHAAATEKLTAALNLDHDRARHILEAFKPPR